ncbi:MAG: hypothetical protein ACK506_20025 [Pirellula sp.]|jgi:hypothetical protein
MFSFAPHSGFDGLALYFGFQSIHGLQDLKFSIRLIEEQFKSGIASPKTFNELLLNA